jgi:DNA-binding NtrC family response regulator
VNVAGIDDAVFSDTLFGHCRGAFTGATEPRTGLIEEATDGTLFLDEIGDLSSASQVKLLRLLQEGEYFPVGTDRPKRMKARVVATTNHDLKAKQASGHFRKDLYYRLCTHHVHIPPLRDRKEDLSLLLDHFLEEAARFTGKKRPTYPKELPVLLETYSFPGNVRELKAMVYDAVASHTSKILSMEAFRKAIGQQAFSDLTADEKPSEQINIFGEIEQLPTIDNAVALLIAEATRRAKGNQTIASRMLGISQPALSKRMKRRR